MATIFGIVSGIVEVDIYFWGCGSSLSFYEKFKTKSICCREWIIYLYWLCICWNWLFTFWSATIHIYFSFTVWNFKRFSGFYLGLFKNFLSPQNFYKIIWFLFLITGIRLAITAISKF